MILPKKNSHLILDHDSFYNYSQTIYQILEYALQHIFASCQQLLQKYQYLFFKVAINELTAITGQKAVATVSRKDIANFKLRKKMPIGVMVTLRRERMYEFLEKLVRVALPRIRDFKGIESKFDGKGNYTLGIQEQIIFPEINIDSITKILGMNITFVTSAPTDEEGYALLKEFGLPFKNSKKD